MDVKARVSSGDELLNGEFTTAFPTGFSYLTIDNSEYHIPLFGKWDIQFIGYLSTNTVKKISVYQITRIA